MDCTIIILGIDVHFIHVKPVQRVGQKVLPLMMVHGWPGSFFEFYRILPMLTQTEEDVVFEVICPSIPGYGYSEAPHVRGKARKILHWPWLDLYKWSNIFLYWIITYLMWRARKKKTQKAQKYVGSTHIFIFIKKDLESSSVQIGNSPNLAYINTLLWPAFSGFNSMDAARVFHKLMERLDFSEYYVQGGDWGALITSNMAQMKPE